MDAYTALLLIAMVATGVSAIMALALRFGTRRTLSARLTRKVAMLAVTLCLVTLGYHIGTGHVPGSPSALGPLALLAEHPSLFITLTIGVVAVGLTTDR